MEHTFYIANLWCNKLSNILFRPVALEGLRQTKEFLPTLDKSLSKDVCNLNREGISRVTQFLTGHCNLRHHLSRIGKTRESACRLCGRERETPMHILRECMALTQERAGLRLGDRLGEDGDTTPLRTYDLSVFLRGVYALLGAGELPHENG